MLLARSERASQWVGTLGALTACTTGVGLSGWALASGLRDHGQTPFATALGPLHVGIDPLTSFFLLCVFLVSGLAALFSIGYLRLEFGAISSVKVHTQRPLANLLGHTLPGQP